MLKKILQWCLGFVVGLLFLVLFLPLFYAMALLMAFVLPPFLVCAAFFEKREAYRAHNLKEALEILFLAAVALPMGILAVAAPLRSVLIAALSFFPTELAKFHEIHGGLYDFFIPRYGDLFPYWLDLYWGIYGVIVIFLMALADSIHRNVLVRKIEILPTSKVRSAAIGLVELKGKAVPAGSRKNEPIIRSWLESTDDGTASRTVAHPFYLDDGSGRVLIEPQGCHVSPDSSHFEIRMHHAVLKTFKPERGFTESRMMPGDEVYVMGNLQIADTDEAFREKYPDDKVIVKPQKSSLLKPNFYDLFFLSNTSEEELLERFRKSIHRGWSNVFALLAITGWLAVYAWSNISQITSMDLAAPPALFRLLSTPTTLEQKAEVAGLGVQTNFDLLTLLAQGHAESGSIMSSFSERGLLHLTKPVLLKNVAAIDHPGFGVANAWLASMNALPPGHWGAAYWGNEYGNKDETLVVRVMLNYRDDSLFASYRANFEGRMSRVHEIARRYVVFEFTDKATGETLRRKIFAEEGWNAVDDLEVFGYFAAGEYSFDMYARREYAGGPYDTGTRKREPVDIALY